MFSLRSCTLNNAARRCQLSVSAVFTSCRGTPNYLQSTQAISPLPVHLFHIINKQIKLGGIAKKLKTHSQNKKLVRNFDTGGGTLMREDALFPGFFFTCHNRDLHERLSGDQGEIENLSLSLRACLLGSFLTTGTRCWFV